MVQFSPEVCVKLFKWNLRNVTVLNTDAQNVQCPGTIYILDNPYLHSLCIVQFAEYSSVYLYKIHQYNTTKCCN